jgi:hypothetical protein
MVNMIAVCMRGTTFRVVQGTQTAIMAFGCVTDLR